MSEWQNINLLTAIENHFNFLINDKYRSLFPSTDVLNKLTQDIKLKFTMLENINVKYSFDKQAYVLSAFFKGESLSFKYNLKF
jgi:hypothetical protein